MAFGLHEGPMFNLDPAQSRSFEYDQDEAITLDGLLMHLRGLDAMPIESIPATEIIGDDIDESEIEAVEPRDTPTEEDTSLESHFSHEETQVALLAQIGEESAHRIMFESFNLSPEVRDAYVRQRAIEIIRANNHQVELDQTVGLAKVIDINPNSQRSSRSRTRTPDTDPNLPTAS